MKNFLRKIVVIPFAALICAIPLINSFAATQVKGEKGQETMETALRSIKALINIDDTVYTEFNYGSNYSNHQTREGLVWSFNWSDGKNGHISAAAEDNGTLLSYNKHVYNSDSFGFADISKDTAIAKASEFLKKANPKTYSFYPAPKETSAAINDGYYNIVFNSVVESHPFYDAQISVSVDKFTGEIMSYYTTNKNPGSYKTDDSSKIIKPDDALSLYAEKIGLSLEYKFHFDHETKRMTVFPAYLFNSGNDKYISALTGEIVEYVYDRAMDNYKTSGAASESASPQDRESGGLTPAEIAAIEKVSGFISSEEALEKLIEAAGLNNFDPESMTDSSITLNTDYYEKDRFFYNIYMSNYSDTLRSGDAARVSGTVDAATGRVLAFSVGYGEPSEVSDRKAVMTTEQAQAAALKFLETMAPSELAKTKMDETEHPVPSPFENGYTSYDFNFIRYENNTPFRSNGIHVSIDPVRGKITSYSLDWYTTAVFPSVNNALSKRDALTSFVIQQPAELKHITTGGGVLSLVYDFVKSGYINPNTGKAMGYDGTAVIIDEKPDYSDVIGHWSESYVQKLLDNGVYLWGGKFNPDNEMTQQEFLDYITQTTQRHSIYPVSSFVDVSPVLPADIKIEAGKPATRQIAAKIISEFLGYGKLSANPIWFSYPYTDEADEIYKGHITVCAALGIFEQGGKFNAHETVTNAQAAKILCNLIESAGK